VALELDPKNIQVIFNLGVAYHSLSKEEKAIEYFKKAV